MAIKVIYSKKCLEYKSFGHPESPERIQLCAEFLKRKGIKFLEPSPCREEDILSVHSRKLLERVKNNSFFDPDTPNIPGVFNYAMLSAGAALKAQQTALEENLPVLSLMRPPGHHAGCDTIGGFCYFNNIPIATYRALKRVEKAAILDLDCHHGNGTEDIFLDNDHILFVSLHQSPLYPGTGLYSKGNCLNYPLEPGTNDELYLTTLKKGLQKIKEFEPEILGISLGFDTYREDPLTNLNLDVTTYRKIGSIIGGLSLKTFAVLEGGYHQAIGKCLYQFILGWSGETERAKRTVW